MKELRALITEKIRNEGLSYRDVGEQVGVAHTTISRILEGKQVRVDTLVRLAEWLQVDPSTLLPTKNNPDDLARAITAIVSDVPELEQVFQNAIQKMNAGEIRPEVVREIVRYAAWRLSDGNSEGNS